MAWVKLDDGFYMHPKVAGRSPAAVGLHVSALCYCSQNLTDGLLPKGMEKRITSTPNVGKLVAELVEAGLWHDDGTDWRMHDYLDFQPTRAKVLADREASAKRQRDAREKRLAERASANSNVTVMSQRDNGVSHGGVTA